MKKPLTNSTKYVIINTEIKGCDLTARKETKTMKIRVNGMMCGHCEAHVKKALEGVDGIESAAPSHADNCVTLTTSKDVDEAVIKAAVEEAGYEYAGIAE